MSETADGKFLRDLATNIEHEDYPELKPEDVARLRELADRCDIVTYPSMTLEAKLWAEVEKDLETQSADKSVLLYLVAVQLKKLSDRQLAAGGLAGMGATMAALVMNKAGEKKPDKKRHR